MGTVGYVFAGLCAQSADCAGGIYTAEAFDGVVVMALSAFAQMASPSATLSQVIRHRSRIRRSEWNNLFPF